MKNIIHEGENGPTGYGHFSCISQDLVVHMWTAPRTCLVWGFGWQQRGEASVLVYCTICLVANKVTDVQIKSFHQICQHLGKIFANGCFKIDLYTTPFLNNISNISQPQSTANFLGCIYLHRNHRSFTQFHLNSTTDLWNPQSSFICLKWTKKPIMFHVFKNPPQVLANLHAFALQSLVKDSNHTPFILLTNRILNLC